MLSQIFDYYWKAITISIDLGMVNQNNNWIPKWTKLSAVWYKYKCCKEAQNVVVKSQMRNCKCYPLGTVFMQLSRRVTCKCLTVGDYALTISGYILIKTIQQG